MAIFTSTTSSGYSDPLKAMSIKALEARQKQLASQPGDVISPENTQTPMQGMAHVFNQLGDSMAQGRVMSAAAEQRERLAQTIAHMDPAHPKGEELAVIGTADPEMLKTMLHDLAESRRQAAGFEHADKSQQAGFAHDTEVKQGEYAHQDKSQQAGFTHADTAAAALAEKQELARQAKSEEDRLAADRTVQATKDAAAEKVRTDAAAKNAEHDYQKTLPQNDLEKLTISLGRKPTEDEVNAAVKKLTAKPPSEEKLIIGEREKAIETQSELKQLDKAYDLINSPKGIHSGNALITPAKTAIGSVLPQSLGGPDDETQANTMQFNQIMKSQGLQNLLAMKGASSDKDVTLNLEIANDVSQPLNRRKEALGIARDRLYTIAQTNKEDIERIGGAYPKLQTAPTGQQDVASEADALKLEPGTRFKLPDGRTGTAR
jgi:hypothetical protein